MFLTLFKGILVGLAVAIPVGPVGLFCLERTTSCGWKTGLASTVSMNLADVFTALLVLGCMVLASELTQEYGYIIKIVTGLVFAGIGGLLIATRHDEPKPYTPARLAATGITTFLLSISPATVAIMLALFPLFNITAQYSLPGTLAGVFIGSAIWSLVILVGGHYLSRHLKDNLSKMKLGAGILFIILGLFSAFSQFI